ncbi:hypothetical protein [Fulvimarina sp. MAC8]|uniref:hypothetical protein n=1 Tax=Fulvimarina sp. MAC8 TaxID=3162874 RepID=UPI0032EDA205
MPVLDHTPSDHSDIEADNTADPLTRARRRASSLRRFGPPGTVLCVGRPIFRSRLARDLGVLLDLDRAVVQWSCLPEVVEFADPDGEIVEHVPDFRIVESGGLERFIDAGRTGLTPIEKSISYRTVPEDEIMLEPALSNARDMMRYARWSVPLSDRVRLLAYLAEMSPITLIEAASAMRESPEPVGAVIALFLRRVVSIEWRDDPIGPETQVRPR